MRLGIAIGVLLLCCTTFGLGQEADIAKREAQIVHLRAAYLSVAFDYSRRSDSLARCFQDSLLALLQNPASQRYAFPLLREKVGIQLSEDRLLRVVSFNYRLGGSNHETVAFAQYAFEDGIQILPLLDDSDDLEGGFTDSGYGKIYQFTTDSSRYYLLLGGGTHGAGHHHKIIRLFCHTEAGLAEVAKAFGKDRYLAVEAPRATDIALTFDPETRQIVQPVFRFDPDQGFFFPTDEIRIWHWTGAGFQTE